MNYHVGDVIRHHEWGYAPLILVLKVFKKFYCVEFLTTHHRSIKTEKIEADYINSEFILITDIFRGAA